MLYTQLNDAFLSKLSHIVRKCLAQFAPLWFTIHLSELKSLLILNYPTARALFRNYVKNGL